MVRHWDVTPSNIGDTKVASKILRPSAKPADHSLATLVSHYFGVQLDKSVRLSDWSAELSAEQIDYAVRDVAYLVPLFDQLMYEAVEAGCADVVEASLRYLPGPVCKMDLRGCGDVFAY